jgi:hypothetical protein
MRESDLLMRHRTSLKVLVICVGAIAVLVAAALAGLIAAVALSSRGGNASPPEQTSNKVAPPAAGTNIADQARNLATWLRQHSR